MKIVNILGGLGNQMFQYSLALALREKFPFESVKIDTSGFNGYPLHNGYELENIFNVDIPNASIKDQIRLFYPLRNYTMWQLGRSLLPKRKTMVIEEGSRNYQTEVLDLKDSAYYLGYWQTEKYFSNIRSVILNSFKFPELNNNDRTLQLIEYLSKHEVVSIHVRRGDYLQINSTKGICTPDYYINAIKYIKDNVNPNIFLIFSDDMDWCKSYFPSLLGGAKIIFVDWNIGKDSYKDMQLMSRCTHNIIANSSFSWWGAWLNENPSKIVITPPEWMRSGGWNDIIPINWVRIKG